MAISIMMLCHYNMELEQSILIENSNVIKSKWVIVIVMSTDPLKYII